MDDKVHATDTSTLVTLETAKRSVESYLDGFFVDRLAQAEQLHPSYARLWETVNKLYKKGGKRLRPYVTLLGYQAYAPQSDIADIVPAAAAQELLHLAMLIHDDIIDRDTIRYGIANVSGQYDELYATSLPDTDQRSHYVDSAALLAGDALLSDSYVLLAGASADAAVILKAQKLLNDAVFTVIGGELLDTESAFMPTAVTDPIAIARYKTASYSFISPLLMGATFGGATPTEMDKLRAIGETTGIAYQLRDDVLGMVGETSVTGKSATGDLTEGKFTELVRVFRECATDDQRALFDQAFGNADASDEAISSAQQSLIACGAVAAIEQRISELSEQAIITIGQLDIPPTYIAALSELVRSLTVRER